MGPITTGDGDPVVPDGTLTYRAVIAFFTPLVTGIAGRRWTGAEHLPPEGTGFVVCANHVSHIDPFAVGHFLHSQGRQPHFLGKASLFQLPVLGTLMRRVGHVPVHRGSSRAVEAFHDAVKVVEAGQCVVLMPESTITRDPQLWPMRGKTGAARIALTTGCPVIPLAQWGPQDVLYPYGGLHPFPRKTFQILVGEPVDLSDVRARPGPFDAATLREATERIMAAITTQLEVLRGESAPPGRWDPALKARVSFERGSLDA